MKSLQGGKVLVVEELLEKQIVDHCAAMHENNPAGKRKS